MKRSRKTVERYTPKTKAGTKKRRSLKNKGSTPKKRAKSSSSFEKKMPSKKEKMYTPQYFLKKYRKEFDREMAEIGVSPQDKEYNDYFQKFANFQESRRQDYAVLTMDHLKRNVGKPVKIFETDGFSPNLFNQEQDDGGFRFIDPDDYFVFSGTVYEPFEALYGKSDASGSKLSQARRSFDVAAAPQNFLGGSSSSSFSFKNGYVLDGKGQFAGEKTWFDEWPMFVLDTKETRKMDFWKRPVTMSGNLVFFVSF